MGWLVDRVPDIAALDLPADEKVARLATIQQGVVARRQLLLLALTRHQVQDRIDSGRFHPIHPGVYAIGHRKLTLKGYWMAAVLACGPDALLSHRFALAVWEVQTAESGLIHVTLPWGLQKPGPKGVRVHLARGLLDIDVAVVDGIPVTSLARSVLDHASVATVQRTRAVLEKIERMGRLIGRELDDVLDRNPNHRGTKRVRAALSEIEGPAPWTQSELEDRFLALIRAAGLPEPELNVLVEGELVDALWRDQKLVVEVDGWGYHRSREQFETDRRRDAKLQVAGYRVIRLTQQRIDTEPRAVAAQLLALLAR